MSRQLVKRKIIAKAGGTGMTPQQAADLDTLKNNEYKVAYTQSINSDSGTITKPTNSTILPGELPEGALAIVETIVNGEPSGESPRTASGTAVTVTAFDSSGNYTLSGVPSAYPVALIYVLKIKAIDWSNLTEDNIIGYDKDDITTHTNHWENPQIFDSTTEFPTLTASKPLGLNSDKQLVNIDYGSTSGTIAQGNDYRFGSASPILLLDIDWNLATHFYKTLSANSTFTFSNLADGKTIMVALTNTASNYTVTWPTVQWSGGVAPTQTTGTKTDVYTFTRINGVTYGSVVQNFS